MNDQSLEQKYRRQLWRNHGHAALYSGNGEMLCSACTPSDYQRAPLADVERAAKKALFSAAMSKAQALLRADIKVRIRVENRERELAGTEKS